MFPLLAFLVSTATLSHAENLTAQLFDSDKKTQLYTLIVTDTLDGPVLHSDAIYKTPDGKISVHEHLELDNGSFRKYSVEQLLAHQSGTVTASGGKVLFSYTADGKTKTDEEQLKDNMVVPATIPAFIRTHWDDLMKGRFVDARFASAEHRETIGFEFFRNGAEQYDEHRAVLIRMKATSMFVSAVVKEMTFIFDKDSKRLLEFRGRLLPKKIDGKNAKDIDGVAVYHYP